MRLGLAEVKKRVLRRQGEAYLVPQLLRAGEWRAEMDTLIGLFESWLGRERGAFPVDRPAELIGDYRMARGLVTVLSEWYSWEAPAWPGPATNAEDAALAARGISSPSQLRLALYDAVHANYGSYLSDRAREAALDAVAAGLGLARTTLDALRTLDADEQTCLVSAAAAPPTPDGLAARYNRRAVEALLANAASVDWLVPPEVAASQGTSLGTLLKRICFLARRLGVYYDVAFAGDASDQSDQPNARERLARVAEAQAAYPAPRVAPNEAERETTQPLDAFRRALLVTLYGPQEAFGGPNLYGERLARLCRMLWGYHRRDSQHTGSELAGAPPSRAKASLRGQGLRGEARIYLRGQPFRFILDEDLLTLLEAPRGEPHENDRVSTTEIAQLDFDSSLERRLHEEFTGLARGDSAHGWRMEREPEPILCGETILIPDFALTRGDRRVYLEVAGYWSAAYRERKRRKLAALAGRVALVVAAPESARAEMAGIEASFPLLWYRDAVSALALLGVLETHFDDFPRRRAEVKIPNVLDEVERRGLLPWDECSPALHTYSRTELLLVCEDIAQSARAQHMAPPRLVEGIGLAAHAWIVRACEAIGRWIDEAGEVGLALAVLTHRVRGLEHGRSLHGIDEAAGEALARAAGYVVARESLFEPRVLRPTAASPLDGPPNAAETRSTPTAQTQPHTPKRRTHQQRPSHKPQEAPPSLWDGSEELP